MNGRALHDDNWRINACPVNGPSLALNKTTIVAAWFTAKDDQASVHIGFSSDGGATFPTSATLDSVNEGKAVLGKVAITLLDSGDAIASWIRRQGGKSQIVLARVRPDGNIVSSQTIADGSSDSFGYPRMQRSGENVLVSWAGTKEAGRVNTTIIRSR